MCVIFQTTICRWLKRNAGLTASEKNRANEEKTFTSGAAAAGGGGGGGFLFLHTVAVDREESGSSAEKDLTLGSRARLTFQTSIRSRFPYGSLRPQGYRHFSNTFRPLLPLLTS